MTFIACYAEKLKTWGLKGAWNYLCVFFSRRSIVAEFNANAKRFPLTPVPGITVVGSFNDPTSLSKVLRDLILQLSAAGIPFQTYDTSTKPSDVGKEAAELLTDPHEFMALKYSTILGYFPPSLLRKNKYIQKYQIIFWEFESGLFECDESLTRHDAFCCMSDFIDAFIRKQTGNSIRTQKLQYPFLKPTFTLVSRNDIRTRYHLNDDFVVFYNFSLNSSYYRKNPEGTLHAFAIAFSEKPNARLLLKINGANDHLDMLQKLKGLAISLGISKQVTIITDYLSTSEIYSITAACDCYISLHRGEGFGLGIAESMSLGIPVVLTGYSAPMEFCTLENSIPIPYKMIPVPKGQVDNPCYRFVREWADPSVSDAAKALKQLYESPTLRQTLGKAAQQTIDKHFSIDGFRRSAAEMTGLIFTEAKPS